MGCLYSTNLSELVVGLNTDLPSENENIVISNTEGAQAEGFRDSLGLMAINHANAISDRDNINSTRIELVPHVHTLFCERKQRRKFQEREKVVLIHENQSTAKIHIVSSVWLRMLNPTDFNLGVAIKSSDNLMEYELCNDDIDCYIVVQYRHTQSKDSAEQTDILPVQSKYTNILGPVLAGPPRLLDLTIVGECKVGGAVYAHTSYIGGRQGASEFWWLRVNSQTGVREQLGEPVPVPADKLQFPPDPSSDGGTVDPRVHRLTAADQHCVLKVKCRPVRSDGHRGEIFTSKPSAEITGVTGVTDDLLLPAPTSLGSTPTQQGHEQLCSEIRPDSGAALDAQLIKFTQNSNTSTTASSSAFEKLDEILDANTTKSVVENTP